MAPLTQGYSFTMSNGLDISASQYAQNSTSNPAEAIRRMTIRQLLRASKVDDDSDTFMVDGHLFKKVILVANVCESDVHATTSKIMYGLDDGTGRIRGNRWALEKGEPTIGSWSYTRVVGELESFRGLKSVKISNIRPIYDVHEVFHHFLHAIFDTVVCEKGLPPPPQQQLHIQTQEDELSSRLDNVSLLDTPRPVQRPTNPPASPIASTSVVPAGRSASERYLGLSSTARVFLQCVSNQEVDSDEELGVHGEELLQEVVGVLPKMTADVFNNVMDSLIIGGFIVITNVGEDYYFKRVMD